MENQKINNGTPTMREALEQMVALYFIFNLEYPATASYTMEVLQRYFLKIHPDQGSRSKKTGTRLRKIVAFINNLSNFDI